VAYVLLGIEVETHDVSMYGIRQHGASAIIA